LKTSKMSKCPKGREVRKLRFTSCGGYRLRSSHSSSWSIVTEEMLGGQHRIDEAEAARAG
jgi:hypothetical protein